MRSFSPDTQKRVCAKKEENKCNMKQNGRLPRQMPMPYSCAEKVSYHTGMQINKQASNPKLRRMKSGIIHCIITVEPLPPTPKLQINSSKTHRKWRKEMTS